MGELLSHIGAAFVGGLILNIMPCVLPVLTMKVFHVVKKANDDPAANRKHGLAYAAGVVMTFIACAQRSGSRFSGASSTRNRSS